MCGVLGINCKNCKRSCEVILGETLAALSDLNQRGEQGSGLASSTNGKIEYYHQPGKVGEGMTPTKAKKLAGRLSGNSRIGHTLYSTISGHGTKGQPKIYQPFMGKFRGRTFALSYNGNVYDLSALRRKAMAAGYRFKSDVSDTEVIVAAIATSKKKDFLDAILEVLPKLRGAFALVFLYGDKIIGVRDRHGIRPLCLGRNDGGYILASESCALYTLNAELVREIRSGEVIILSDGRVEKSFLWTPDTEQKLCMFEWIYLSRPDSRHYGRDVNSYRYDAGTILAEESPVEVDLVVPVPEAGRIYADAYGKALGIVNRDGLYKNRYGSRTFMASRETDRRQLQRRKLHPLREVISGNRILLSEDSVVRGNVGLETVRMCREAGATEVHVRVFSAPIRKPCFYGIDMPTEAELVAANHSIEEIGPLFGADSLSYLSLDGMIRATGLPKKKFCLGCFTGEYPVAPPTEA